MDVLESNGPGAIQHVDGRERRDNPVLADRALQAAVPPASPGDFAVLDRFSQRLPVTIGVDAQQGETLAFETLNELSLFGVHSPARATPVAREGQHDDLAPVVAQLEWDA